MNRVEDHIVRVETEALQLVVTTNKALLLERSSVLWFRHDPAYQPDLRDIPEEMREGMAGGFISTADDVAQLPKGL